MWNIAEFTFCCNSSGVFLPATSKEHFVTLQENNLLQILYIL